MTFIGKIDYLIAVNSAADRGRRDSVTRLKYTIKSYDFALRSFTMSIRRNDLRYGYT